MGHVHRAFFNTTKEVDIYNASHDLKRALADSKATSGLITVMLPQAAGAVTVLENDPEIRQEIKKYLLELFPNNSKTRPVRKSGSGSIEAHLRGAFLQSSAVIPFHEGRLLLGAWQEVVAFDFDDKIGRREILFHVMGEAAPQAGAK